MVSLGFQPASNAQTAGGYAGQEDPAPLFLKRFTVGHGGTIRLRYGQ